MRASGDSSTLLLSASQTSQWASVIPKSSCCHQTPTTHCRCHTEASKPRADSPSCRKIEVWSNWMMFSSGQYPSFVPKMLKICLGKNSTYFPRWTLSAQGVLTMQLTAARDLKKKKIWTKCPSYKWPTLNMHLMEMRRVKALLRPQKSQPLAATAFNTS